MKKLLILLFSILISFNSYGEWTKIGDNVVGETIYIDTDTIKEHNGYVYYWALKDLLKPSKYGDMSVTVYFQGDCGVVRIKYLSFVYYKQPMGRGTSKADNDSTAEWRYPTPDSSGETLLDYVCDYVK